MFRNYVIRNFPFLEDDFDALTDYQLFCKMCGYVIKYSKDNKEMMAKIEEFQHYFDNLDVQEEIDKKLDEMAESGELAEIINEEIFDELNTEILNNKINQLVDNTQSIFITKLQDIILEDYSVSSIIINENNKGIAVENDWSIGGSGGQKFKIVTFDYNDGVVSNVITRTSLLDGHSNSMCDLGDNKILICANGYNYIYDLSSNNYTEISSTLPYFSAIANNNDDIYATDFYTNKLYKLNVDVSNNTVTIEETNEINGLNDIMGGNTQGMVIYNGLIIYPSYAPGKLCIFNLSDLQYIKTQTFTAPYITEYEDGFVLNNKLYLVDSVANIFEPDIYGKKYIGSYSSNSITKSTTDIVLYDDFEVLDFDSNNVIPLTKYMSFMNANTNTDIATVGSMFESITLYFMLTTLGAQTGITLTPVEIPCFKALTNANLIGKQNQAINQFANNFNSECMYVESNKIKRQKIFGTITYGGTDTLPTLVINPNKNIIFNNYTDETNEIIDASVNVETLTLYKVVGHRKVGNNY